MNRYFALSAHLRQQFGERVQKIPLDAGFSCPNRDGTISRHGCVFCNPRGSGSGMLEQGMSLTDQWTHWSARIGKRYKARRFIAYLQSYSNTYGPVDKLARVLDELKGLPGIAALSIGTRPDCLDAEKLALLADLRDSLHVREVFLELGLQSASDATLACINRGHTAQDFANATRAAADCGLSVVAHLMAGLPSPNGHESANEFLASVDFINALPVRGVKFHNLYVCRGTPLARMWHEGEYTPLTQAEYLDMLGRALMRLRPETVIHRLNGNPAPGEHLAPDWAGNMRALHNAVRDHLERSDIWQGKRNGAESGPSPHFSPDFAASE